MNYRNLEDDANVYASSYIQRGGGRGYEFSDSPSSCFKFEGSRRMERKGRTSELSSHGFNSRIRRREDMYGSPTQFQEHNFDNYAEHSRVEIGEFEDPVGRSRHPSYRVQHQEAVNNRNHSNRRAAEWQESRVQNLPFLGNELRRNSLDNYGEMLIGTNYADNGRGLPVTSHRNDFNRVHVASCCQRKGTARGSHCDCESCQRERYLSEATLEQERMLLPNTFGHKKLGHPESPLLDKTTYRESADYGNRLHRFTTISNSADVRLPIDSDLHASSSGLVRSATNSDFVASSLGIPRPKYPHLNADGMQFPASHDYARGKADFESRESRHYGDQKPIGRITTRKEKREIRSDFHTNDPIRSNAYEKYIEFDKHSYPIDDYYYGLDVPGSQLEYDYISRAQKLRTSTIVGNVDHDQEKYNQMPSHKVRRHDFPMDPYPWNKVATQNYDVDRTFRPLKSRAEHVSLRIDPGIRHSEEDLDINERIFHCTRSDREFPIAVSPPLSNDMLHETSLYEGLRLPRPAVKRNRLDEQFKLRRTSNTANQNLYVSEEEDFTLEENVHGTSVGFVRDTITSREIESSHDDVTWVDDFFDRPSIRQNYKHNSLSYSPMYNVEGNSEDLESEIVLPSCDSELCNPRKSRMIHREDNYPKSRYHTEHGAILATGNKYARRWQITQTTDMCHDNLDNENEYASKDWKHDIAEESDEFWQKVNEEFLKYSKRLSLNSSTCRRYKEQGKAGSLFCIVCARSSKEFLNTQRLAIHAFMSPKVGLRVKHLGLWKAICVLMGWNSHVSSTNIKWIPQILPDSEVCAQKEDVILWPPIVIIYNISMSNENLKHRKVIPHEKIASFLRGKGLIEGKMIGTLGYPTDHSVILLKFLGTFTGLGNADRVHKYFAENNRGRLAAQQILEGSKRRDIDDNSTADTFEELLYGYLGTSSDLVHLDLRTKNQIYLKSRRSIQDLADGPVRSNDK